jgi:hypothetical protein
MKYISVSKGLVRWGKCEEGCDITAKRTKRSIAFCYSKNRRRRRRGRFFLLLTSQ